MKLRAFLIGACIACGSSPAPTVVAPAPVTRPTSTAGHPAPTTIAAVDPHLAARRAYQNPGGMWMPQQMTLPGHADAFRRLGVPLDPKVLADPEVRAKLENQAAEPMPMTPEQFSEWIRADVARWTRLVQETHLKLEQ